MKANDFFAFLLVGLIAASTIVDFIVFKVACSRMQGQPLQEFLAKSNMSLLIFQLCVTVFGYGTWFFAVQSMWRYFDSTVCLQGWNLLDFINFLALMIFSVPFAASLSFFVLAVICCGPCIYSQLRTYFREQAQNQENKEEQIAKVI